MKYYKILKGNWGHYKIGTIYPEDYTDSYGYNPSYHYTFHKDKMKEVSYADYLKQEYDAGRISFDIIYEEYSRGKIGFNGYVAIYSNIYYNNNKTNNMVS